jgi:hypothetical protein
MKPSDTQPKLPLWSYDEVFPKKYKLVREHDGLTKTGTRILWVEWDSDGVFNETHPAIAVGRSLLLDPRVSYIWLTTAVTEILEERDDYIKFRTTNSIYELFIKK